MRGVRVGSGGRERLYVSTTATFDPDEGIDYIAVESVLNGRKVRLTKAERLYAARLLSERGESVSSIASAVGADKATVSWWRECGWKPQGPRPKVTAVRSEPVCGEPRMYRRHLKAGERCEVCRAANAAADRRYRLTGSRTA